MFFNYLFQLFFLLDLVNISLCDNPLEFLLFCFLTVN